MNLLPTAEVSERAVLGCLVLDGIGALEQCNRLSEEMLELDSHRKLYRVITDMLTAGDSPDYMSIGNELRKRVWLEAVGGMGYILDLSEGLPRNFQVREHVEIIIEKWKLRTGMKICDRYQSYFASEDGADVTLSAMQGEIFDAMQELGAYNNPLIYSYTVPEIESVLDYEVDPMGMSYGISEMDEFTNGMQPGEVTVIGARPGVGKTSLVCQAIVANCRRGIAFDFFSLEMKRSMILRRIWAIESGLPLRSINRKLLNLSEREHLRKVALRVAEWPLRIYDDGDLTLGQMAAMARLDARRHDMAIMAVDYVQIVNADGKDDRIRVSNACRTLTKLAKKEDKHLILLSQLRKVSNEMYSKPPHIGDLRETGQLENDAHLVALLHRGWDEDASALSYEAEIIIPKQRSGATGAIKSRYNPFNLTFS